MTGTNRTGLGALLLAVLVIGGVFAGVGTVSAAATMLEPGTAANMSEDGGSGTVSVQLTADSNGITNETVELALVDPDTGDTVYTDSKTGVDVSADATKDISFNVSASDLPDEGDYTAEYTAVNAGLNASETGAVTVTATESIQFEQSSYNMADTSNETQFNVTVEAPSPGFTDQNLTLTIIDASNGDTVSTTTLTTLNMTGGEDATVPFILERTSLPDSGSYTVEVTGANAEDSATFRVESVQAAGGSGGDGDGSSDLFSGDDSIMYLGALASLILLVLAAVAAADD